MLTRTVCYAEGATYSRASGRARVRVASIPNMGHYAFSLISIRRLTQCNLGSPGGLPAWQIRSTELCEM